MSNPPVTVPALKAVDVTAGDDHVLPSRFTEYSLPAIGKPLVGRVVDLRKRLLAVDADEGLADLMVRDHAACHHLQRVGAEVFRRPRIVESVWMKAAAQQRRIESVDGAAVSGQHLRDRVSRDEFVPNCSIKLTRLSELIKLS